MRIAIIKGHIIDPALQIDRPLDLYVADGRVVGLGHAPDGFQADFTIDASHRIVCPGLVDLAARLREPGQTCKGTIASETKAAASGGITTVCCLPDTLPILDNVPLVEWVQYHARQLGYAKVLPLAAMTQAKEHTQPSPMAELKTAGCIAVAEMRNTMMNTAVRRRCFEYAATFGMKIVLIPEDYYLAQDGCIHEGIVSTRLGLPGIPTTAETIAIARDLLLIEQTGVSAHFGRISSAAAVDLIAHAQARGLRVTCDVAAHQLHLTDIDASTYDSNLHLRPPLRTEQDRLGLLQGLSKGVITAICSDHQPHDVDAKRAPFSESEPGISAFETLLALTLRLVEQRHCTLPQALNWLTNQPARIFGLNVGTLGLGAPADICIFDLKQTWRLADVGMLSMGHNTPFWKWEFHGRVTHTLLDGKLVYLF